MNEPNVESSLVFLLGVIIQSSDPDTSTARAEETGKVLHHDSFALRDDMNASDCHGLTVNGHEFMSGK